ncbi:MAG: diaminopimelate epimerase [Gammaproteobacteria bacterium]|nr:diaminopimelate epimerase [Gammaproteobacteria bacterium]
MTTLLKTWQQIDPPGRYFIKMQGLRNHFVIVDGREDPYDPGCDEIINICDPQTGVGGDQLVIIEPTSPEGTQSGAYAFMRLLNIDGREVEACGNATRCVAWLLMEERNVDALKIETRAGVLECRREGFLQVSCVMGKVSMDWQKIPLSREHDTLHLDVESGVLRDPVGLNIGNPHAVFFVDDMEGIDLKRLAPPVQKNELFPQEVNVGLAQMIDAENMRLAVYERGAGLTTACGSGACVAVFAAIARGLTRASKMTVLMPAGPVSIEIRANDTAVMTGPVDFCFTGSLPEVQQTPMA